MCEELNFSMRVFSGPSKKSSANTSVAFFEISYGGSVECGGTLQDMDQHRERLLKRATVTFAHPDFCIMKLDPESIHLIKDPDIR
jgi:hypothetical protein